MLCAASQRQTILDGVAYDRRTEVTCDGSGGVVTPETTLTSVTFDGETQQNSELVVLGPRGPHVTLTL